MMYIVCVQQTLSYKTIKTSTSTKKVEKSYALVCAQVSKSYAKSHLNSNPCEGTILMFQIFFQLIFTVFRNFLGSVEVKI